MPVSFRLVTVPTVDNPDIGDIYLDPDTGSYELVGEDSTSFVDAVAQTIRNRLLFFKGEWFLDQREGTPWFEEILIKSPDLGAIRSIFTQVIQDTEGVSGVHDVEIAFDRGARTAAVSFTADLTDGTTLVSSEFSPFLVRF